MLQKFNLGNLDLIMPDISEAFEGFTESGEYIFSISNPSNLMHDALQAKQEDITFQEEDEGNRLS
jgi:hypothetical protein